MSVINNWSSFRYTATIKLPIAGTFTFADANPDTIARAAGDWVADGVEVGMIAIASGTASNDNRRYHVASLTTSTITLRSDDVVVAEVGIAATITFYKLDPDGVEQFPGLLADTNKVRSGGFSGGITGVPTPYSGSSFTVTVNSSTADSSPGVPEYDWYLSQKTDDPAKQWLAISELVVLAFGLPDGNTYSGAVEIVHTSLAETELGFTVSTITMDHIAYLFRFCDLYCVRRSDGAIQWVSLLPEMMKV